MGTVQLRTDGELLFGTIVEALALIDPAEFVVQSGNIRSQSRRLFELFSGLGQTAGIFKRAAQLLVDFWVIGSQVGCDPQIAERLVNLILLVGESAKIKKGLGVGGMVALPLDRDSEGSLCLGRLVES